jgi:large subunit ribosomal protein L24e
VATAPCRVFSFSPRPQDSTFEFEKRRNKPVRYDRDLMGTTIRAIKRVGEIQAARQERFYKNRMVARKAMEKAQHQFEISQNIDLVAPAVVRAGAEVNVLAAAKTKQKAGSKMDLDK